MTTEPNSVDLLNRKYREEAEKNKDKVEPNPVDELNRDYQDGKPTAAEQTEAQQVSLNPEGGLEEEKKK